MKIVNKKIGQPRWAYRQDVPIGRLSVDVIFVSWGRTNEGFSAGHRHGLNAPQDPAVCRTSTSSSLEKGVARAREKGACRERFGRLEPGEGCVGRRRGREREGKREEEEKGSGRTGPAVRSSSKASQGEEGAGVGGTAGRWSPQARRNETDWVPAWHTPKAG